jgi:transcription antitermination factor NusG
MGHMVEPEGADSWKDPKWYVLFVRSNQEKRVTQHLRSRDVEHYLPCYSAARRWKDRRVTLEVPLFPGYIFVHVPLLERMKAITVPNVVSLVGTKDNPSVISDEEINQVRLGVEHGKAEPYAYLKQGDRMTITSGVMAGMEGVLVRRQNGMRMIVALDSIGKAFLVEVDSSCLKPSSSQGIFPLQNQLQTLQPRVSSRVCSQSHS